MKVTRLVVMTLFVCTLPISNCAFADSSPNAMAQCFADNTTGKDRKDLARWLFALMALHPEVASMAPISPDDREQVNKTAGALLNRLLTQTCKNELRQSANNSKDPTAMKSAFEQLGRLAMQELMANPNVSQGASAITKYVDVQAIREAMITK